MIDVRLECGGTCREGGSLQRPVFLSFFITREEEKMAQEKKEKEVEVGPTSVPKAMPVLPLRNSVFFPRQVMPLTVGREGSIKVIEEAAQGEGLLVIVAQMDEGVETPKETDIHWFGTLAKILKTFTLADGTRSVLVQGIRRVQLISILHADPYLRAVVREREDTQSRRSWK